MLRSVLSIGILKDWYQKVTSRLNVPNEKKLRYIITPEGIALRAKLTVQYIENQMRLYRVTRQNVIKILTDIRAEGYNQVRVTGESEIADVCQLTCLEQGFEVVDQDNIPTLAVNGYSVSRKDEIQV